MTTLPMGRSSALVCPQISGPLRCAFLCDAGYVLNLDITSVFVLGALVTWPLSSLVAGYR